MNDLSYSLEPALPPDQFITLLRDSGLGERRPIDDPSRIADMLRHADITLTARTSAGHLVGVSRALTDFSYCTYLSDLAVAKAFQRQCIGKELIRRTHEAAGLHTTLILLAAPAAESYYPRIAMKPHNSCWIIPRQK